MVNYLFDVTASVGNGGQVHDQILVGLTSAEVQNIIEYLKEYGRETNHENFQRKYPELAEKINKPVQEKLSGMLASFFFTVDETERYWWEFPEELRETAEDELGHPLPSPDAVEDAMDDEDADEMDEEEADEMEQWIKEHSAEIMDCMEAEYQARKEIFQAEHPEESKPDDDILTASSQQSEDLASFGEKPSDNISVPASSPTEDAWPSPDEIYDVAFEMNLYDLDGKLVDVIYSSYSRFSDEEKECHYIGQIGSCTKYGLTLTHPMDPVTRECLCGASFSPVHEIKIAPVSETDVEDWRRAAHEHSDVCRRCDKEDWQIDHPEYDERDDAWQKAFRYIDSDYDLVNAEIDAAIPYQESKLNLLRL